MAIITANAKLRHNEYYGQQSTLDELYEQSLKGAKFVKLYEKIIDESNILLAYRNIKANTMDNPLSLIMLIDKIKDIKEFANLRELKQEYWERAKEYFKDSKLLEIVAESITLMLTNINISEEEITTIKDHLYEGRLENMSELAVKYDVQKIRAEGRQEGILEGAQQEKIKFARKLLGKGNSIEDVAEMTDLLVEEVRKLQH